MIERARKGLLRVSRNGDPSADPVINSRSAFARSLAQGLRNFVVVHGDIQESTAPVPSSAEAVEAATRFLEAQRARQLNNFVALGFHEQPEINLPEGEYRESFDELVLPPAKILLRFPAPLFVEGRLSPKRKLELANIQRAAQGSSKIEVYIDNMDAITDEVDEAEMYREPLVVWTHNGRIYAGESTRSAQTQFTAGEKGDPFTVEVDKFLNFPEFFENFGIFAASSRARRGSVPGVSGFFGGAEVSAGAPDGSDPSWGVGSHWNIPRP